MRAVLPPTPDTLMSWRNSSRYGLRREAEKELRVLAHDEMGEELHLAPAFDFRIGLQRNMEQVAHSAGFDDGVGGRRFGELPLIYSYILFEKSFNGYKSTKFFLSLCPL